MKPAQFARTLIPLLLTLLILAACSNLADNPAANDSDLATLAATTYYVSPSGNDSNVGSEAKPFKTIAKASTVVKTGDTVYLRQGVYKEYVDDYGPNFKYASGTATAPITIMSYPDERAVIDGSNLTTENGGRSLLRIEGNYYVVRDLDIRKSVGRGLVVKGNHNIVRGVRSFSNRNDGILVSGDNNTIERNESYDNYNRANGGADVGGSADGIELKDQSDGNLVRHNRVYYNSDDGIDIWDSTNTRVEYNISYRNGRADGDGNGYKLGGGGSGSGSTRSPNSGTEAKYNVGYKNKETNFETNQTNGVSFYRNTSWNALGTTDAEGVGFEFGDKINSDDFVNRNLSFQDDVPGDDTGSTSTFSRGYGQNSWQLGITNPGLNTNPSSASFMSISSSSPAANVSGSPIGAVNPGATLSSNIPSQTCGKSSYYGACP